MNLTAIITSLLTLLAGIGVFLLACQMMSSNLEAASSKKLKKLFSKASGTYRNVRDLERIADHMINIAKSIRTLVKQKV